MTIDEVIEILQAYLRGDEPDNAPNLPASIRLGIEALKRERERRKYLVNSCGELLPGETEE